MVAALAVLQGGTAHAGVGPYQGLWTWGSSPVGLVCNGSNQICRNFSPGHWAVDGHPILKGNDAIFGARTLTVVDSGFDMAWNAHLDVLTATVTGDASFIALSDGTRISIPSGTIFGTSQPLSLNMTFSAVGLAGTIVEGPTISTASCTPVSSFSASAVTTPVTPASVPAIPGTLALALAVALVGLGLRRVLGRG
jgi:hypothetical protein